MIPRKLFHTHAVMMAALAILAPVAQAVQPQEFNNSHRYTYPKGNLIENGSFEANRTLFDWTGWWEGLEHSGFFSHPETDPGIKAYEGNRYLAMQYRSPGSGDSALKVMSDFFTLRPKQGYTLFFRYRTALVSGKFRPVIRQWRAKSHVYNASDDSFTTFTDNDGASYLAQADTGSLYQATSEWTLYKFQFTAAANANFGNLFLVWGPDAGTGGKFYFDDVLLFEGISNSVPATDVTRKYLDGNNRPLQTLRQSGSVGLVTATVYDSLGRVSKTALPIGHNFTSNPHGYLTDITGKFDAQDYLSRFYNPTQFPTLYSGSSFGKPSRYPDALGAPYSETRYENSPLGRVVEAAGPGIQRMGAGHTTQTTYASAATTSSGSWATGESGHFFVQETTDPDGQMTREFTDRMGRVVRKSSKLGGVWIHTDYTFDGAGNLQKIEAPTVGGTRLTTTLSHNLLKEVVKETTPSTGDTKFFHDLMGRPRFTQTQVQANGNSFSYSKYDSLGRMIETGEILNASYMTQALADSLRFPCSGCAGTMDPGAYQRVRARNHYDDTLTSALTCGGSYAPVNFASRVETAPILGDGATAFLALNGGGSAIAAGYTLLQVYQQARTTLGSANGKIQMIFTPGASGLLSSGAMTLQVGSSRIELEALNRTTTAGHTAQGVFNSFNLDEDRDQSLMGSADYLKGRLVKSLACNWEVADSLGHTAPREVSQEFRYDAEGNTTRLIEINGYVADTTRQVQVTKTYYDVQNRPTEKVVCANTRCAPEWSHQERYVYDQMGRVSAILGKGNTTLVENLYNQIGQLSNQNLGGGSRDDVVSPRRGFAYRAEGWLDSTRVVGLDSSWSSLPMFRQKLYYENSTYPRYGGDISRNDVTLASNALTPSLSYQYQYDGLNRLTSAVPTPNNISANESYLYLDDGRIDSLTRGSLAGGYNYSSDGRLRDLTGNLVSGRELYMDFIYDANGNMIVDSSKNSNGAPLRAYYRPDNLPYLFTYKLSSGEAMKLLAVYDASGNRVSKISVKAGAWAGNKNYFNSGKEIREAPSRDALEYYSMAQIGRISYPEASSAGHRELYLTDHLGTTRAVYDLDSAKATYSTHSYPYGKALSESRTASEDVTQKFTTKELDDGIDLTYFGARWYDQDLGQWISPDRARQFHSVYSYDANPINSFDPNGNNSYLVIRGLQGTLGRQGVGHPFIVTHASSVGDKNGRVFSYGQQSSGNMGLVNNNEGWLSRGTYKNDVSAWQSYGAADVYAQDGFVATQINAPDDLVAGVAMGVKTNLSYDAIPVPYINSTANSASGAQAVANFSQGSWVQMPNAYAAPGVGSANKVEFNSNPCLDLP